MLDKLKKHWEELVEEFAKQHGLTATERDTFYYSWGWHNGFKTAEEAVMQIIAEVRGNRCE